MMNAAKYPFHAPRIIHHMAALDDPAATPHLPNSLEAIRACLDAGADSVEIDVTALADSDYLLVHDALLERETTGTGPVEACTPARAETLRFAPHGVASDVAVPLLSQVVKLFLAHPGKTRLQVDYKNVRPFPTEEPLQRLVNLLRPLEERVIVSSMADWQLRRLRALAPWLDLGFDVHFHIDHRRPDQPAGQRERAKPPFRLGVYGYWDDHPLAHPSYGPPVWTAAEYLADRCATLSNLVPGASTFYLSHRLLVQSLADGFNWAEALHRAGIRLDAWTLDAGNPEAEHTAATLAHAGVDYLTTNTPRKLIELLTVAGLVVQRG